MHTCILPPGPGTKWVPKTQKRSSTDFRPPARWTAWISNDGISFWWWLLFRQNKQKMIKTQSIIIQRYGTDWNNTKEYYAWQARRSSTRCDKSITKSNVLRVLPKNMCTHILGVSKNGFEDGCWIVVRKANGSFLTYHIWLDSLWKENFNDTKLCWRLLKK